jgi:D-arabinose 1-dehydrogenase-like Zn-dependent alcohol dehydrogenase
MSKMRMVQVTRANETLEIVEREIPEPGAAQVRIKVEACGICHSDAMTKEGLWPGIQYPRVPGHEVAGIVDAIGPGVLGWNKGQRAGVGWHGGHCGYCDSCRRGDFVTILGIGGLGHLGIQFAAKMGFKTVAIARGMDKEPLARKLGASSFIDSKMQDPAAELLKLGGAKVVLATVTNADAMSATLGGLAVNGKLVMLGAAAEPLQIPGIPLILGRRSVMGWPSGSSIDSEDTLKFSLLTGVRAMSEVFPLERAAEAYEHMMSGKARFRAVIATGN